VNDGRVQVWWDCSVVVVEGAAVLDSPATTVTTAVTKVVWMTTPLSVVEVAKVVGVVVVMLVVEEALAVGAASFVEVAKVVVGATDEVLLVVSVERAEVAEAKTDEYEELALFPGVVSLAPEQRRTTTSASEVHAAVA